MYTGYNKINRILPRVTRRRKNYYSNSSQLLSPSIQIFHLINATEKKEIGKERLKSIFDEIRARSKGGNDWSKPGIIQLNSNKLETPLT